MHPNSGRIEPGKSVDVFSTFAAIPFCTLADHLVMTVLLQSVTEETPPTSTKCEDMFLIQSTLITSEKRTAPPQNTVGLFPLILCGVCLLVYQQRSVSDGCERSAVQQKILQVFYLPPEGQIVEAKDESVAEQNLSSQKHPLSISSEDIVSLNPCNAIAFKSKLISVI